MHRLASAFILGYHGCDKSVAERVLAGEYFRASENDYDWLGPGIYFWEANPQRGLDFANELIRVGRGNIKDPTVIGAVIELGLCLDLTTAAGIQQVWAAHEQLMLLSTTNETPMPKNSPNLLRRNLDCAVLRVLHEIRKESGEPPIDTVRGVFIEGDPIFPDSGFREKTHIQIAVCNPECIKGAFRVPPRDLV